MPRPSQAVWLPASSPRSTSSADAPAPLLVSCNARPIEAASPSSATRCARRRLVFAGDSPGASQMRASPSAAHDSSPPQRISTRPPPPLLQPPPPQPAPASHPDTRTSPLPPSVVRAARSLAAASCPHQPRTATHTAYNARP